MRTTGFVTLACLVLAGCGPIDRSLGREWGREKVRLELLDRDRAVFADVELSAGGGVCGRVNAPNRLGGMTGFQRFVVTSGGDVLLEERIGSAKVAEFTSIVCGTMSERLDALERTAVQP